MSKKDTLYQLKQEKISSFVFDQTVTDTFDDMLHRSIPFYDELQLIIKDIIKGYPVPKGHCYDLGCSTANVFFVLESVLIKKKLTYIGVDNSKSMIQEANQRLLSYTGEAKAICKQGHIEQAQFDQASVVLMVLTLQFINLPQRLVCLKNSYDGLSKGGLLFLVEKVISDYDTPQKISEDLYDCYKLKQGYSRLEIDQKKEALHGVLKPIGVKNNIALLEKAGFKQIDVFFKWMNFVGILAIK